MKMACAKIMAVVCIATEVAGLSNAGEIEEMLRAAKYRNPPRKSATRAKASTGTAAGPFGNRMVGLRRRQ